jgi:arylsulfatase A-like enzyme
MLKSIVAVLLLAGFLAPLTAAEPASRPNIVVILADDLGTGDVKCLNPEGKIATPHLDALAAEGCHFTDAHSPSAVCSPTRYGLITGRYAWRSQLQNGVLGGLSPRLIEPDRLTIAQFLKDQGYHTACIGKWHLGMDWHLKPGKKVNPLGIESRDLVFNVDYDQPIKNGPNAVGFDEYFGISASLDMVPYTFIKNDRVVVSPTEDRDLIMFSGKAGRTRKGPAAPGFEAEGVLPELTRQAVQYIRSRANQTKPFFLYVPLTTPHTPVAPSRAWAGKSQLTPYADFVMETDATVGAILDALKKQGFTDNTLVIFTSDNGCSPQADFPALLKLGHNPNFQYRGHKADVYEGGHRVPFLVRWPGKVKPKSSSKALVCLTDIFATVAEILNVPLPATAAEDSVSFLSSLGLSKQPARSHLVVHSINGSFGVREGKWKLCLSRGSGGWSAPRPGKDDAGLPENQLFDLDSDLAETTNLHEKHPDQVQKMTRLLEEWVKAGRSTPGPEQKNTVPVRIRK